MKKLLLACALGAAFTSAAQAADVQLYGVADVGLRYSHVEKTNSPDADKLEMMTGQNAGSRFGLKGTEKLADDLTVGFQLEGQYNVDDGALKNSKFFHRQASLYVTGAFGRVEFGRMGTLSSAAGTYDLFYGTGDAFDGGDGLITGVLSYETRRDNTITYQTPTVAGLTGFVQYSFGAGSEEAQIGANERYMGAGLRWQAGALTVAATAETVHWAKDGLTTKQTKPVDDKQVYGLAANYDFGVTRVFTGMQYAKGADNFGNDWSGSGLEGFGLQAGAVTPVAGGYLTVAAGWATGEHAADKEAAKDYDLDAWSLSTRFVMPLSKTFSVYAGAGFQELKQDMVSGTDVTTRTTQVYAGLTKKF